MKEIMKDVNLKKDAENKSLFDCFSQFGQVVIEKLYYINFNTIPSTFIHQTNDEDFIVEKITDDLLHDIFSNDDIEIKRTMCRQIFEKSSAAEDDDKEYDYTHAFFDGSGYNTRVVVINYTKNIIVVITHESVCILHNMDNVESYFDEILLKLPKEDDKSSKETYIDIVSYENGSYYTISSKINSININFTKNYNDDFKEVSDNIIKFLDGDERKSGLVLLNGEPGTGKTYFLRHLITNIKQHFILIPSSLTPRLSSPDFISFLISNKDSIFILEDCEDSIKDRGSNSFNPAVAAILNMADGLMSDIFNGKFICTFNCDIKNIDDAIRRKGRCVTEYEFLPLNKEKAKNLLKELGHNPAGCASDMTLAEIYNYTEKENITKHKKIGF